MNNMKLVMRFVLLCCFSCILSGCLSTQERVKASSVKNPTPNAVKTDDEVKKFLAMALTAKLNNKTNEYDFSDWRSRFVREHALSNGVVQQANLDEYEKNLRSRFSHIIEAAAKWRVLRVAGDHIYLGSVQKNMPITLVIKVVKAVNTSEFAIVDYKLLTQAAWSSDVLSFYSTHANELESLGYFSLLKKLDMHQATERDLVSGLERLPKDFQQSLIVQSELITLGLNEFPSIELSNLERLFKPVDELSKYNASLWMRYFYLKRDFDAMVSAFSWIEVEHSQALAHFKLIQASFSLKFQNIEYAKAKIIQAIRLAPRDIQVYKLSLFIFLESGELELARYFLNAIDIQFSQRLTPDDLIGVDSGKIADLFENHTYSELKSS